MDTLQETARLATSKPVQRALVNTILLGFGATTLLGLASIASGLFFHNFVPHQVLSTPVHLQYGSGPNPYALVSLSSPGLKSAQDYDISVNLMIPRSKPNVDRGNFMVSIHLLDLDVSPLLQETARQFVDDHDHFDGHTVLFSSRRPALVPYLDPLVSTASRVLFLFYYMFFPGAQTTELNVVLAERVSFPKGTTLPGAAYLEIEAGQDLQTYQVSLILTAQLRGLRWLMFHYRLPMYIFFTLLFWFCEVVFMGGAWSVWSVLTAGRDINEGYRDHERKSQWALEDDGREHEILSDRQHEFGARLLKSDPDIKEERKDDDDDGPQRVQLLSELPIAGAEADDEYEDDEKRGGLSSSAAGTGSSYNKQRGGDDISFRRRSSHNSPS